MPSDGAGGSGRTVVTLADLLAVLDALFDPDDDRSTPRAAHWWDRFYDHRDRDVPFFRAAPDESLVSWAQTGTLALRPGARVLELGCGPGRNAVWMAQQGYHVDALDLSGEALDWAAERAEQAGVRVRFTQANIFDWDPAAGPYDLVYDAGCFHHLPPHRRLSYRDLLDRTLEPGGFFGLACFAAGGMGSEEPDEALYRTRRLHGGLAYRDQDLRQIFGSLDVVQLRRMIQYPPEAPVFGEAFLWAALFRRPGPLGGTAGEG